MTGRKRKASIELTSDSVSIPLLYNTVSVNSSIAQSVYSYKMVEETQSKVQGFFSWVKDLFLHSASTTSSSTTEIVTETHIQSVQPRENGTTAIKRQKHEPQKQRSRSTEIDHRKAGMGLLDYTGCMTDSEIAARNEEFWAPPEPAFLKKKSPIDATNKPPTSSSHAEAYQHRVSVVLEPSTPSRPLVAQSRSTDGKVVRILSRSKSVPDSLSASYSRSVAPSSKESLERQLESLFLTLGDGADDAKFRPSVSMSKKREKYALERKAREREAAIRAAKEARLHRRFPSEALIRPLSLKWEDRVKAAEWSSGQDVITTSIGGTELRLKDFQTLLGHRAWLNDEIINSYIEWIVDAANKAAVEEAKALGETPGPVPKFIAHNSFFFETLRSKGPNSTERLMKRKKAAGKALLEVDSVFVPICKGAHWTLGVVRPVAKTIEYFDSMGGDPTFFITLMRQWLKCQLADAYIDEEWTVPRTMSARQTNGYDCGVFVCTNAFCVACGLETSCYEERDMTLQRRNIAAILLNRGFVEEFAWGRGGVWGATY
ncbi:hypothetical protein F5884DRAFT_725169 [Xylogone sp. PMI_703]|nr:hypothetical protein F5884DRAFT_725169 [Xylogone sp. PMI_703]